VSAVAPFRIQPFESIPVAAAQFSATDRELHPILLTAPDGQILLVARAKREETRRRPVAH
jgi:hypothetical protein